MTVELTYRWLTYMHRCWTGGLAVLFATLGAYSVTQTAATGEAGAVVGALVLLALAAWLGRIAYRTKQVDADEEGLVVTSLRGQCRVPYEQVESVYQCLIGGFSLSWWHHPLIRVRFKEHTPCGQTIVFVPATQSEIRSWWYPIGRTPHPTVAWLEERVRKL